jgi:putative lipoprotein
MDAGTPDDRHEELTVSGTVTYRPRIALAPGAVLTVRVLDVSRADAAAITVAEQAGEVHRQVPLPFELRFDPSDLDPRCRLSVSAQIHLDGQLRWTSDTHVPVSVAESTTDVEIVVVPVGPVA